MNRKLSDWASIAEIASGIAVVVTLVVLILGIRENTESIRASAFAANLNALNEFQTAVLTDPDALRVWDAFVERDASDLDGLDETRLNLVVATFFNIYENAYYFDQYGLVGDEGWERFDRNVCGFFQRAQLVDREELLRLLMSNDFFEYVTDKCLG